MYIIHIKNTYATCYLDFLKKTHRNPTKNSQGKAISVLSVICFDSAQCQHHTIEGPPSNETTAICKYVNVKLEKRRSGKITKTKGFQLHERTGEGTLSYV